MRIKKRIHEILEVSSTGDSISRFFDIFIVILIFLNIIAVILETVEGLSIQFSGLFGIFEIFSVVIFTLEYILRIWSCTKNPLYKNSILGRIKFIFTPLALVDLFAVLPFYLPMVIPLDLRFIRAIRLLRLIRLLKLGRYSEAIKLFGRVLKAKKEELFITVFAIFILLTISSSLLFYVEHSAQPEVFSSIPAAMWWGVATLTTVGYGDIYPVTTMGKILGAVISLLGIGLFAMPAGILSAGFVEEIRRTKSVIVVCPKCGHQIDKN